LSSGITPFTQQKQCHMMIVDLGRLLMRMVQM